MCFPLLIKFLVVQNNIPVSPIANKSEPKKWKIPEASYHTRERRREEHLQYITTITIYTISTRKNTATMWSKTAKKFRRMKPSSSSNKVCDADMDICKNNSLPDGVVGGGVFAIVGKTPSADDASMMAEEMLKEMIDREYDAQPDVCKNNSSSTESELTMSNGPSASGEEERGHLIAQMPSDVSDEFESDDEDEGEENELDEDISAGEAVVVDDGNDEGITTDETTSVDCNTAVSEPTSEVAACESNGADAGEETAEPTLYQKLERMMHERTNSINQMSKMLSDEIKLDFGKSFGLYIFTF
jgi:hypothetical protein